MKKLLGIVSLSLFLITPSQADDIQDFQIEGMSIGDSLLDYFSEEKIKNSKVNYLEGKRNFYVVGMDVESEIYDFIEFYLKTDDNKYLIHGISAGKFYEDNYNQCEKKKNEVSEKIKDLFEQSKMKDWGSFSHSYDKSGLSKQTAVSFNVQMGTIRIECTNWTEKITKENNWFDNLSISAVDNDLTKWFEEDYP